MRLQDSKANCGPTALANALEALGHARSVGELEVLCRTSATDGTSPRNMLRAAQQLGESCGLTNPRNLALRSAEAALGWAVRLTHRGVPLVLLVDGASHYATLAGALGARHILIDSADSEVVQYLTDEELLERWTDGGRYWALVLE